MQWKARMLIGIRGGSNLLTLFGVAAMVTALYLLYVQNKCIKG